MWRGSARLSAPDQGMRVNKLFYGDNLEVLRDEIASESVDLIYLDPPFNSNASYNILFKSPAGGGTDASIEAFGDTWEWGYYRKSLIFRLYVECKISIDL